MNILNESNRLVDSKYLEELFTDLQLNIKTDKTLDSIKKVLNTSFSSKCKEIVVGERSQKFYGMTVYPTEDSLKEISKIIISPSKDSKDVTKSITNISEHNDISYIVEIDPNLLYSKLYNFNPDELVAILLHEVGHVSADTDFYNDLAMAFRQARFDIDKDKSKFYEYNIDVKDIQLGMIYVLSAIQSTQLINKPNMDGQIEREKIADKFVVDNGYGTALSSALGKISKIYLNNYKKSKYEEDIKADATNAVYLMNTFTTRRKYVETLLDTEIKKNDSGYIKALLKRVQRNLSTFKEKISMNESSVHNLQEGFFERFKKQPIKVSQMDIDDLRIQAEMMDDWDDKSILVYKIHKRISQLDKTAIELSDDKQSMAIINSYQKQLQELLKEIMKFKVVEKRYGVFLKYPKGYEG